MKTSQILKWVSGGFEALLGIPFFGGLLVISLGWSPLGAALILHIVTLIFCAQERTSYPGSILGIVTSLIAWIPFVGMIMHLTTAIVLLISAAIQKESSFFG